MSWSLPVKRWLELAADVLRRFPLAIASSVLGAAAGCLLVVHEPPQGLSNNLLSKLLFTLWMGIPLFLGAALVGERQRLHAPGSGARAWQRRWVWSLVAALMLAACFVGLHRAPTEDGRFMRFALWMLAAHSVVAVLPVIPVIGRGGPDDFRAFNVALFIRTVSGLLLTHVLFAGLSFALFAVDKLFDVRVPNSAAGCLWFALLGTVNTFYVLAGMPRDWDRMADVAQPPALLDILARYVLLPLSALYLVILYVYSVKILAVHEWPRGWVSAPIIVFSAVGLLTVLLLGPDGDHARRWVRAYRRGFFVALMPLVVLLFLAISRRAVEYGLTEERCLVFAIAIFLAVIAPYFVFSRARKLASIPLVLGAIALLASVGPLSAFSLAVRSQTARLRGLLERNARFEKGSLVSSHLSVSHADEAQMSALLGFLVARRQMKVVTAWTAPGGGCPACASWPSAGPSEIDFMKALGMEYRTDSGDRSVETTDYAVAPQPHALRTTGFDWIIDEIGCHPSGCSISWNEEVELPDGSWSLMLKPHELVVMRDRKAMGAIPLDELIARLRNLAGDIVARQKVAPAVLTVDGKWARGGYRLLLNSVSLLGENAGDHAGDQPVHDLAGTLLLRLDAGN